MNTSANTNLVAEVNPAQAAKFCVKVILASRAARKRGSDMNIVPLMVGQPGLGKTSVARQIARKLGYDGTVVITPTIYTVFDLRGLPTAQGSLEGKDLRTVFAAGGVLPTEGKYIVLIDELADCPIHEQSGFYQLFLERRVGDYVLPEGCDVIGATNDETHGACANPISAAIKTRVAVVRVKPCPEQTVKYAVENGWHPRVIAFIKAQPDCVVNGFDKDDYAGGCTGRGLEMLSELERDGMPGEEILVESLCTGLLGAEYGARYNTFRNIQVPDPELVFSGPEDAPVPADLSERFLYCCLVVNAANVGEAGPGRLDRVLDYAARLNRVDGIGLVMDSVRRYAKSLKGTSVMRRVAEEYAEELQNL